MKLIALAVAAAVTACGAHAQSGAPADSGQSSNRQTSGPRTSGFYVGGGPSILFFDDDAIISDDDPGVIVALQGKGGYAFNRFFAIEAEAAVGIAPQTYDYGSFDVDVDLKYEYGIFGVLRIPTSSSVSLFARAGFAEAELEVSSGNVTAGTGGDSGAALGVGLDVNVNKMTFRVDYTHYDIEPTGDALSFNFLTRF